MDHTDLELLKQACKRARTKTRMISEKGHAQLPSVQFIKAVGANKEYKYLSLHATPRTMVALTYGAICWIAWAAGATAVVANYILIVSFWTMDLDYVPVYAFIAASALTVSVLGFVIRKQMQSAWPGT